MDINKEDSKQEILNVDKELLRTFFLTQAVAYSGILKPLIHSNNDELLKWLCNISNIIESNHITHVLSQDVKNTLYKILSMFRDRFNDSNVLNQVNELISLLNQSSEENYTQMMNKEFSDRILNIAPFKNSMKMKKLDWGYLEQIIKSSICKDYGFFLGLIGESESEFLEQNVKSEWALTNISNLIVNYSKFLREQGLIDRIIKLLDYNISSPKTREAVFGSLQDCSRICLKKIKRIK